MQLRVDVPGSAAGRIVLLRKDPLRKEGGLFRVVTSQADWPTYNGDPGGNRCSKLTAINKLNVAQLAPRWIFPLPNVTQVENTPLVVEGLMYVSRAPTSAGRSTPRFQ